MLFMNPLKNLGEGLLDLLLPRHCAVSGRPLLDGESGPVAPEVLRELELAGDDYCTRCGAPQGKGVGVIKGCVSCNEYRDGFGTREIAAVGSYQGVLQEICLAFKFGGERRLATPLAAYLAQILFDRGIADKVDVLIPMPLHPFRRFQRGYNQAELIARALSDVIGKPLLTETLKRTGRTHRQAMLSPLERRQNVEGVFSVQSGRTSGINGKIVLLVDDVMTTGATLASAARTLKKASAKGVFGAVVARASLGADR
jgi:ComF family protein